MFAYSITGLTAEHFATARRRRIKLLSDGPSPAEFWVSLAVGWRAAPLAAMPALLGVTDLGAATHAAALVGGALRELTADEQDDAELLIFRAGEALIGAPEGRQPRERSRMLSAPLPAPARDRRTR